jgi:hypothetical protein
MTDAVDFDRIRIEEQPQADRIAEWFGAHHRDETILDVGCGPGIYVDSMRYKGLLAYGVDNDPRTPVGPGFWKLDVAEEGRSYARTGVTPAPGPFEVVLSLEVGEHIPEADAGAYVDYLVGVCPSAIYFSAARPGQGGEGHINCKIKAYWLRLFCERGYYFHPEATEAFLAFLRQGPHMGWLLQNGMIFERVR